MNLPKRTKFNIKTKIKMSNVGNIFFVLSQTVPFTNPIFQACFCQNKKFCQHCKYGKTIHNFQNVICQVYSFE